MIDLVLAEAALADLFEATVSSRGGAARKAGAGRLPGGGAPARESTPPRRVAIEDSSNGLRSAAAAGMSVIAIPNAAFPPDPDALAQADAVLESIDALQPELVAELGAG